MQSQSSYYSVNDLRLHFGLGAETKADEVTIRWPTGEAETLKDVPADQVTYIQEGNGIIRTEKFSTSEQRLP